ncbi:gamma-glutamyltransferase family protein [Acinetobacter puyangensis]|uniref:gamma-glutamyltransferase family protein n=1 Tax=Acinetobacter puyangensis TaxID=1096779 RepID=UPI003A4E0A2B
MNKDQLASTKSTFARQGMVTSPHTLASQAGLDVLQQGGNAIEAAITVASVLSVTYPHFNGLGGDAFMVFSDAHGEVMTLSGIGQSFQNLKHIQQKIPERGIGAALTTACTVDTWGKAFEYSQQHWQGKMVWQDLFKVAIDLAEHGTQVTESQKFWFDYRQQEVEKWAGFNAIFSQHGNSFLPDQLMLQPQLAQSLKRIAEYGYRDFYEGELAVRIVQALQKQGSTIELSDLQRTHARLEKPLSIPYRNGILYSLQPPTQGITTLEIMGILSKFDLRQSIKEGSADYYHILVEAIKRAFLDRNKYVGDPDFSTHCNDILLSKAHLTRQAQRISLQKAAPWSEIYQHGDTVYIGVVDAQGRGVSMLQTIYYDWGSGVVAGDTGILWHNRGASFSLDPNHVNCLAPCKRPFHTLNPGIYTENGQTRLLFGTQGADGQPQTLATILTRLIDYDFPPYEALQAPRFLLGKTFSSSKNNLKIEEDADIQALEKLLQMGHQVERITAQNPLSGQPGVIRITSEGYFGAHDPRSDGRALGY